MAEANRLGVRVHLAHLEEDFLGIYDDRESRIYIRIGMTMAEVKEVLAHELAHAFYRHQCSTGPHERVADRRAAQLLVDVKRYEAAERLDPSPWAIADELGLTAKVIEDFQRYWLSDRTG